MDTYFIVFLAGGVTGAVIVLLLASQLSKLRARRAESYIPKAVPDATAKLYKARWRIEQMRRSLSLSDVIVIARKAIKEIDA